MLMSRQYIERGIAHYALHGWRPVYGSYGTVGFWNDDAKSGVGVFYRETIDDPDGEKVGEVTTLGRVFMAPINPYDLPDDIFEKIAKYTKVPAL